MRDDELLATFSSTGGAGCQNDVETLISGALPGSYLSSNGADPVGKKTQKVNKTQLQSD